MRKRVEQSATDRRRLSDDLCAARQLLGEFRQSHGRACQKLEECKLKVLFDNAPPALGLAVKATPDVLETWLAKLEAEIAAGRWLPVRVGVRRWRQRRGNVSTRFSRPYPPPKRD